MGSRPRNSLPQDLADLADRISSWRQQRRKFGPMPQELWDAAVSCVERHGMYTTAQGLEVDYGGLRQKCMQADRAAAALVEAQAAETAEDDEPGEPCRFVEVDAAQILSPQQPRQLTTVELSAPSGATMTIRLSDGAALDMAELVSVFLGRHS